MLGARNDMVYTRTLVDIYLHEPECTEGKIYFAIGVQFVMQLWCAAYGGIGPSRIAEGM